MDQKILGDAAVQLMESIEGEGRFDDAKMIAVGIVVILEKGDQTYTRTYSNEKIHHRAVGLFEVGLEVIREGLSIDEIEDGEDDDDG